MKPISRTGGGGFTIPTEDEVEVAEILLNLPKLIMKSDFIGGYSFTWGRKKKRSVLDLKSESRPENVTAGDSDKSPSTPLYFDDGDRKPPVSGRKILKRKVTDDLMEVYIRMQQERGILIKKIEAMKTLHQDLTFQNLELKAKGQKINYSRNMEDFHKWNSSMKVFGQQHCHQQMTMFAHQQLVVDPNNGKLVAVTCSSNNNNSGGRFGFNHIDPRVKIHHGETYDFMACPQPLDQSRYLVMDNDLRARNAAAARKRRRLRMKENKNSLLAMKLSRSCR